MRRPACVGASSELVSPVRLEISTAPRLRFGSGARTGLDRALVRRTLTPTSHDDGDDELPNRKRIMVRANVSFAYASDALHRVVCARAQHAITSYLGSDETTR